MFFLNLYYFLDRVILFLSISKTSSYSIPSESSKLYNPLSVIWLRADLYQNVHNFRNINLDKLRLLFNCSTDESVNLLPPALKHCNELRDLDTLENPELDISLSLTLKSYSPSLYLPLDK